MKLVSWNVNGLRACLNKGFTESINMIKPDIICLQETKMQQGQADIDLNDQKASDGSKTPNHYMDYWNSADKKGYSGTAVFTKIPPMFVTYGMGIDEHDHEGRIITLEFETYYLVTVYTPNSQSELTRLDYRMHWEDDFRAYVCGLDKMKPVIICGDLNCAHQEIDLKNPKSNTKNAGFTKEERDKMTLLLNAGFTDYFRFLYPERHDAYTWWSYMRNAREKNTGWRIDYFLGSNRLTDKVQDVIIYPEIYGSDHCPVSLVIDL